MAASITRRQIARYAAHEIAINSANFDNLFKQLAEWLVATKSTRSADLLVADIEKFLAQDYDIVYAKVTTAQTLESSLRAELVKLLQKSPATKVVLNSTTDESIIGGVIVQTAEQEFDASVARSIKKLKALTR